jgi:Asp-tRNA(Asn)/Glu-tRNA(Gln) amidotransferase A subunit family amidase
VLVEDGDVFGDGVNVAARLQELAAPGGICLSWAVRDQVGERVDVAFEDGGERSVKNIARPLRVFQVLLDEPAPSAAFRLGEKMDDPVAMYLNDVFAVPASLAGLPALSLPGGLSEDGLPLGLQLIARAWDEATLFQAASALEAAIGFDTRPRLGGPGR